jgi:hypothetical protein
MPGPASAPDRHGALRDLASQAVHHLAAIERPSASDGEREAAEWIAARLREEGCEARVEEERAHGTYWWPLGVLALAAGAASFSGRRWLRALAGGAAAAAVADDISGGRQWFRRAALPSRPTWNVVAQAGDPDAERTVLVVAHHDAAHWSLLFAPQVPRWFGDTFPALLERSRTTPPVMFPVFGGPLLVALGGLTGSRWLRRLGGALALGTAATMAEIGSRSTVPGANDNLSGVAVVLGLARTLRERPVRGLRVLLVSTGSEESFMEGMQAFARRHFASLPTGSTHVVCVDTVGSPTLMELEGEGMLWMRDYPEAFKDLVAQAAEAEGVELVRGLRFRNATDGLIALKAGYPTVMLGSITRYKAPANYHWPTDTAENVDFDTVADCARVVDAVVRRLAADPAAGR